MGWEVIEGVRDGLGGYRRGEGRTGGVKKELQ